MTVLKIKRLEHNRVLPEYKTEGAAGMDLCAAISEPVELKPLERTLIPTGLKIELEHGYEAQIRPRSGMSIKHGITLINCVGTIDEDYRGEVCVPVVNISNEAYTIQPDERIAQMVIARAEQAKLEVVTELSDTERGEGGFGSTGK
ncbi:MAG: dUTP diphosphatase [Candidatus Gastranaerophilales bacterium]|nr:dUTP diphosphatase [Candidatus Gastranaerophilales bacterium]